MTGRLVGKVAFVTGAARGVGRAHAVRFAREGADIIALDVAAPVVETGYPPATKADLDETGRLVRLEGRQIHSEIADVRDYEAVEAALSSGVTRFGSLDVMVANAGVGNWGRFWEIPDRQWREVIDVNLNGTFNTMKAAARVMIPQDSGGSMVVVSSVGGLKALPGQSHYVASKHAVTGLVRTAAIELAPFGIRVNSLHPWGIDTDMGRDTWAMPLLEANPTYLASFAQVMSSPINSSPDDIAAAGLWLASDEARTVTGTRLSVDHGATVV